MKIQKALEIVGKLDAASKKRLSSYQAQLGSDKCNDNFDKEMRNYLLDIQKSGCNVVQEANVFLDSVGWNQGTKQYSKLIKQVDNFCAKHTPNRAWRRKFKKVKSILLAEVREWQLKTLNYTSIQDIVDALPRLDTHAGWEFILTGLRTKGDYKEGLLENYLLEENLARENNSFNKPILIGIRTQSSIPYDDETDSFSLMGKHIDDFLKTRLVSMISIYQILAECKWAVPFQRRLGFVDWYAGGKDDNKIRLQTINCRRRYVRWYSLDYSKFDQSIPAWLIRECFDVVREAFIQEGFDEELFSIIREDFIHKVFVTADGLVEAHDGVPSGDMFTQIIDSLANRLMIDTYMAHQTDDRNAYTMIIMGDDNIIFTSLDLKLEDVGNYLKKEFGVEMNPSKVKSGTKSQDPEFLSRIWKTDGVYRSPKVLVAKLLFPERRREYARHNFRPSMVVQSYFDTFYLGMISVFHEGEHLERVTKERNNTSASRWLTGYERYKTLYLNVS